MADSGICNLDAATLAERIRRRQISPVDAVEAALRRIEETNPKINAFCCVLRDSALEAARAAEQRVMHGAPLGPLHGVPVAIKDLTPVRGVLHTRGCSIYRENVAADDAIVVQRLREAGAIVVGTTTTSELAASGWTETRLWGITRNPWNLERTPGGSSGGSAAAVAAGCIPLAEGSDHGGSIRYPSAFCGTVGMRPSRGRIPMDLLPTAFEPFLTYGPISRSVTDAALFLHATAGAHEADFLSLPLPLNVTLPLSTDPRGLRLALSLDLGYVHVSEDVRTQTLEAAAALRDRGAAVEEVDLRWTQDAHMGMGAAWCAMAGAFFERAVKDHADQLDRYNVDCVEQGWELASAAYRQHELTWTAQWQSLRAVFERFDALLCPTMAVTALPVGERDSDYDVVNTDGRFLTPHLTSPFSQLFHLPVLSVPSGWSRDGMPTGLQIVGRRFDEATVLRVGAALEQARPWADRRPSL